MDFCILTNETINVKPNQLQVSILSSIMLAKTTNVRKCSQVVRYLVGNRAEEHSTKNY